MTGIDGSARSQSPDEHDHDDDSEEHEEGEDEENHHRHHRYDDDDEEEDDDDDPFSEHGNASLSQTLRALTGMMASGMSSRIREIINSLRVIAEITKLANTNVEVEVEEADVAEPAPQGCSDHSDASEDEFLPAEEEFDEEAKSQADGQEGEASGPEVASSGNETSEEDDHENDSEAEGSDNDIDHDHEENIDIDDDGLSSHSSRESSASLNLNDDLVSQAEIRSLAKEFLKNHETEKQSKQMKRKAAKILNSLADLSTELEAFFLRRNAADLSPEAGRELFVRLANYFDGDVLESVTSAEILASGLIKVLLNIFSNPDENLARDSQATFLEIFMDNTLNPKSKALSTPFSCMVHKLQDVLSRSEHFDVVTVQNGLFEGGRSSSASFLAKQIKLKLVADDDSNVPKPYRNMMVSIHAIASFQSLADYLRPRIEMSNLGDLSGRWQNSQPSDDRRSRDERQFLGRLQRQKVRIGRAKIFESALKVMNLYGAGQSILEVEYFEEVGTGLGPTLEFYATISREFAKKKLKLWRETDSPDDEYVNGSTGLFPRPMSDAEADTPNGRRILHMFAMLGKFVARSMLDSRLIDINFNPIFFRIGDGPMTAGVRPSLGAVNSVDPDLARSLKLIKKFALAKKEIEEDATRSAAQKVDDLEKITINGCHIDDLCLDFTLPGFPDVELIPNGDQTRVTIDNVENYLDSMIHMTLGSGVRRQIDSFRAGFTTVFPYSALNAFTPDELVSLFGRVDEDWSLETLMDSIKADHGFNMDSRSIRNLLQLMSNLNVSERRDFLQFTTGSPKLPIGGFKALKPMFTVLPDYSDMETMRKQLMTAIKEGQGAFHLS
ncbi:putative ubiquitin fusion degradation protein C12B10.01c [Ceratocystis platani]|uniref:Putative ubiquitin fusion degradation protein C12B10.01c n=1 Tax=Ceratocystis fimbriata f. sp. platani TaxID=88771 RepID=A0A0F8BRT3_CERFI|nr:putative ubiquitin fusion degradation protein C12B10.01c [Ceratocystis platani]